LEQDYENAGQPVVFLEYDIDDYALSGPRRARWTSASGSGGGILPFVMIDSGNQYSSGYEDFATKYKAMVDASLARDATATIVASGQRVGDTVHFDVQVTNRSTADIAERYGTVWAIVYEEFATAPGTDRHLKHYVRTTVSTLVSSKYTNLPPSETGTFTLDTGTLSGVNWDNLRAIVLVDYRPSDTSNAYDTLQATSIPIQ